MKLRFYKKNDRWYADVPGHTEEENEMVSGSDTFLNLYSKWTDEAIIEFTNIPRAANTILIRDSHDEFGATYVVFSRQKRLDGLKLWICNVTHDVLGEHPEIIMIQHNIDNE